MPAGWSMPSVISISWAWAELETADSISFTWSQAAIDAVSAAFQEAAALGITVFAASGDQGAECQIDDNQAHCYYPATDPWVTCCGGTSIENVSGSSFKEVTWNDFGVTGGGISDVFPLPGWQVGKGIPPSLNAGGRIGRGIPDIAGYANGYNIVLKGDVLYGIAGTSETAPLYAGLIAVINSTIGYPVGYLNPILYGVGRSAIVDINDGGSNSLQRLTRLCVWSRLGCLYRVREGGWYRSAHRVKTTGHGARRRLQYFRGGVGSEQARYLRKGNR